MARLRKRSNEGVKRSLLARDPSLYICGQGRLHTVLRLCGEWFMAFFWLMQSVCLLPGGRMVTFGAEVDAGCIWAGFARQARRSAASLRCN